MSKKRVSALIGFVFAFAAHSASAAHTYENTWGDADTNIYVGTISPYGVYIVMQRVSDESCRFHKVGDAPEIVGEAVGLWDDVVFRSGDGDDQIFLGRSSWVCGYHVGTLPYNGHFFDVHGGGGDDRISSHGEKGDSWFYGDSGNDFIEAVDYPGARVYGGPGDDVIFGADPTHNERLYGDEGNDAICDARYLESEAYLIDGGSGTDCSPGNAVHTSSIESSNCGSRCIYIY